MRRRRRIHEIGPADCRIGRGSDRGQLTRRAVAGDPAAGISALKQARRISACQHPANPADERQCFHCSPVVDDRQQASDRSIRELVAVTASEPVVGPSLVITEIHRQVGIEGGWKHGLASRLRRRWTRLSIRLRRSGMPAVRKTPFRVCEDLGTSASLAAQMPESIRGEGGHCEPHRATRLSRQRWMRRCRSAEVARERQRFRPLCEAPRRRSRARAVNGMGPVDSTAASSTGASNLMTSNAMLTTHHSHSIVNSRAPLRGKMRRAQAPNRSDTDKSTVAFERTSGRPSHTILAVNGLRRRLVEESGQIAAR